MDGGRAGEVWYSARLEQDQLRADYKAAEAELRRSGQIGGDAFGDGVEQGAREGAAAIRSESKKAGDAAEKNLGGAANRVREGWTKAQHALAAVGVAVGIATVTGFLNGAVDAASNLNEEASKTEVVFGDAAGKVKEFASTADTALGQSERQALGAAGAFGNMFRTIGFADDAAADMSIRMVQLASDMASFNNQDPGDMLERLRSGLAGEAEPLRQFGVLLSEARVKAKAYEAGIADVGAELTEAEKVQARYLLILEDTTLQHGDFARTADGVANSQRQLAAQWENAQARIGQALLPVASALISLASDVLPALADGFLAVFDVLAPFVGMLGTLAGLWAEHADILLPALIAMLGVRLVGAMSAADLKAKALTLTMNGLRAAMLVGLPIAVEVAHDLGDEVSRLGIELREGSETADAWMKVWARMDTGFFSTPADELDKFRTAANELGVDWRDLASTFIEQNDRTGISFDDFMARVRSWSDGSAAELQEAARDWPAILAAGARDTEAAAAPLEGAISTPLIRGADAGVEAVDGMFARIAERIAERENQLREAGGNAVEAWLDPQLWANQAEIIKAELKEANAELLTAQQEGTKAEVAEAKNRVLQLTAEAIELQVNLATTGSNMEQAAKLSALATSDFMQEGLASRDPEIRALFRAWYETLVDTGQEMELEAGRRGGNVPIYLEGGIKSGTPGVHGAIRNLTSERPDTSWAHGSGYELGSMFNAGLAYWIKGVGETSLAVGAAAGLGIKLESPAKAGALSEPAGNWSRKLIADFLAPIWSEGIPAAAAASLAMGAAVAGGIRDRRLPGLAFAANGAAALGPDVGRGATVEKHYHVHADGPIPVSKDEELAQLMERSVWISEQGAIDG